MNFVDPLTSISPPFSFPLLFMIFFFLDKFWINHLIWYFYLSLPFFFLVFSLSLPLSLQVLMTYLCLSLFARHGSSLPWLHVLSSDPLTAICVQSVPCRVGEANLRSLLLPLHTSPPNVLSLFLLAAFALVGFEYAIWALEFFFSLCDGVNMVIDGWSLSWMCISPSP